MRDLTHFNKLTADALGVDESLALKVNKYFWRNGIRKNLTGLTYTSIYVKNLITINLSKYKVDREIRACIKKIRIFRDSPKYKEKSRGIILEKLKANLRQLLKKRNELIIIYNEANKR